MAQHTLIAGIELAAGVGLLFGGATSLLRGATRWGMRMGVSATLIGLTVVAFGTTLPELAVGAMAAASGRTDIAIATTIGSSIFNVLGILGVTALVIPICAHARFIRREVPLMVAAALTMPIVAWDGRVTRVEAGVLLALLAGYVILARRMALVESQEVEAEFVHAQPPSNDRKEIDTALIALGSALLAIGAWLTIMAARSVAEQDGLTDSVIGLTLIAAATSLPELVTTLVAVLRREPDVAMGNIVGGNIFNMLGVVGVSGMLRPLEAAPDLMKFSIPVLVLVSMAMWPIVWTDRRVGRGEGALLLGGYVAYAVVLVMYSAPRH